MAKKSTKAEEVGEKKVVKKKIKTGSQMLKKAMKPFGKVK